jgi:hypothetical protein
MTFAASHLSRRRLLQLGAALSTPAAWSLSRAQTAASAPAKPNVVAGYTELRWDDLVPKGWDPMKGMKDKGLGNAGMLNDGDPKTVELMRQMREAWDNAPTEPTLNGAKVRLPGYLVPLEEVAAGHTEFLLVPYFGACIHTPPPPANQIVLVVPAKPAAGYRSMDTVWVSGVLKATRTDSPMGSSGYRLESALVERYKATVK